mmetsp:Transcript_6304/g.15683  ORF Transcript_6304/g.15683 Transcript_6304/m.15683 type:complete len:243 (+) Transcript_6304:174-902(+)
MVTTSGEKKDGLLPPGRVSAVYNSFVQTSTHGTTTIRILAFAAGMGLIACSVLLWTHWIVDHRFSWVEMAISISSFAVGTCAFLLETNLPFSAKLREKLIANAPILGKVTGRGSMYAAIGLMQCAVFTALHLLVGLFTAAVGIYMIQVGRSAAKSLSILKNSISDEKALLKTFQANDRNGDGVLEMFEFEGLILALGIELDSDELDAAFSSIDTNNDKKIVYDEFRTWWKTFTAETEDVNVV